jgi:hypothetical protein
MLDSNTIKKIEDFVYSKPRSIQEIAEHLEKNWRTADRYIQEIEKEFGTLSTRTFREGTRGALKVVYWASIEKASNSVFQEILEREMMNAKQKFDFSAFDIFQHISAKNKKVSIENEKTEEQTDVKQLADFLQDTKKQLLIFSGNLSFINLKNKGTDVFKILESLVKKGVSIKTVCRVDLAGKENVEKLLSLNFKHGKELVEIRHKQHPIRALISDGKMFRIKEIKEPTGRLGELDKRLFIFYTIKDKEWTEWLSRIFWKMFSSSIGAGKRIDEMKKLV